MILKQTKAIVLCLMISVAMYLFLSVGVAQAGGSSGHNGMPASALDLVDFPAVSLNPTTNIVYVGACADVIVQPSMQVPAADVGQTAQLIMYLYLPDLGSGFNIHSMSVTLQDETLCDLLPNPIDLSTSAGLSFYVYYGYVLGSSIKYSAYAVVVEPNCANDCGSITDASVCDATPGCTYESFPVAQCVPDCVSFTSKASCEDAFNGDSCVWNDTFSTCIPKNSVYENIIFSDDFSRDLSKWYIAGSPTPSIVSTEGNPAPAFSTNDDLNHGGWAFSKSTFDYSNGLILSVDTKPGHASFPDQRFSDFVLNQGNALYMEGSSIRQDKHIIRVVLTADDYGTTSGWGEKTPGPWISFYIYDEAGNILEKKEEVAISSGSGWHNIKVKIQSDLTVQFYLDDTLLYTTQKSIPVAFSGLAAIGLGHRLAYFDNVNVSTACESTLEPGGLVASYELDGNAVDSVGGYHGAVRGPEATTDRDGYSDSALLFDGIDDYIELPGNFGELFDNTNGWTIAVWFNTSDTSHDGTIIGLNENTKVQIRTGEIPGELTARYKDTSAGWVTISASIPEDDWTHVAYSYDPASGTKVYIDGEKKGEDSTIGTIGAMVKDSDSNKIGMYGGATGGRYFQGAIDNIQIYNKALTQSEISALAGATGGLVASYELDGNAVDLVGGYHGAVRGPEATTDRDGYSDSALLFDGIDDYIELPGNFGELFDNTNGWTIAAWFNTSDTSHDGTIIGLNENTKVQIRTGEISGELTARYKDTSAGWVTISASIPEDDWTHVAYSYDPASGTKVYIDGEKKGEDSTTGTMVKDSDSNKIGMYGGATGSRYFQGAIDNIQIYNKALTQSEISALAND